MRNVVLIALVIIGASFSVVQKKQKVVFFGDSITQAGVDSGGYITVLRQLLEKKGLKDSYELVGSGIGGNKVYDLYLRMEEDVLAKNPDIVVIWVGVNDVWHKRSFGTGTDADKFEKFYHAIIKKLRDRNIKVMICTPSAIGEKTDFTNQLDGDLNQYSNIIRQIGTADKVPVIDLRKAFLDYNLSHNKENKDRDVLTSDGVHLNATGNRFVADRMYEALRK